MGSLACPSFPQTRTSVLVVIPAEAGVHSKTASAAGDSSPLCLCALSLMPFFVLLIYTYDPYKPDAPFLPVLYTHQVA